MGGNIFSNLKLPEYPDFTGDRAKYEALKHAELQRKLQTQQALMQQAEFGRKQQDWQRQDAWQAALQSSPLVDPETGQMHPTTLKTLMGISPAPTLKLAESIADQAKARSEAEIKKQATLEHQQQLALHDIDAGMQIKDPQERLTYVMQNWERYKKLNVLTQDEHEELARDGLTVPLHDRMATRLLGADKFGEYQKKALELSEAQLDAAAKAQTRGPLVQKTLVEAEEPVRKKAAVMLYQSKTPEEWNQVIQQLPEAERAQWIGKKFNPKNRYAALQWGQTPTEILTQERLAEPDSPNKIARMLNDPNTPTEDLPRLQATLDRMIKTQQATQPPSSAPLDYAGIIAGAQKDPSSLIGLPGDVYARIQPELTRLGIKRPDKNPITPAIKGKVEGLRTLESALQAYEAELKKVGPTFQADKGAALNTAYINLMSLMKGDQMYQLGVLQPADMALVEKALADPSGFKANIRLGTSGMLDQLQAVKNMLATKKGILNETYDIPGEIWSPARKPPTGGTSTQPNAKAAPNPIVYKDIAVGPNGHKIGSNDGQKTWYDLETGKKVY